MLVTSGNKRSSESLSAELQGWDRKYLDCRLFAGIYLLIRIVVATFVNWRTPQQIRVLSAIAGLMLAAVFQPHTRTPYNVFDSLFFTHLVVVFILLPAGQSHHTTRVCIFFLPLIIIIVFVCWKLIAIKKYISGSQIISRLRQIQKFCNKISFRSSDVLSQDQEQEPLVDNNSQSSVLYTVMEINS